VLGGTVLTRLPTTSGPIFSFTFDDGNASQLRDYYPILKKYDFRATFYVVASEINRPGKLASADLEMLRSEGNEIGSHGFSHRSLTEIGGEEVKQELRKSLECLKRYNVRSFAYPYGERTPEIERETANFFDSGRGYGTRVTRNKLSHIDRFSLQSFPIEGSWSDLIDPTSSRFFLSPDSLSNPDQWYIVTLHGRTTALHGLVGNLLGVRYLTRTKLRSILRDACARMSTQEASTLKRFEAFCTFLSREHIPVMTVSDALAATS
jgi:peptidoglycan/xylan/chitin deacetylase (PgdA/CDA1 family)